MVSCKKETEDNLVSPKMDTQISNGNYGITQYHLVFDGTVVNIDDPYEFVEVTDNRFYYHETQTNTVREIGYFYEGVDIHMNGFPFIEYTDMVFTTSCSYIITNSGFILRWNTNTEDSLEITYTLID